MGIIEDLEKIENKAKKFWYKSRTIIFNMLSARFLMLETQLEYFKTNFDFNLFTLFAFIIPAVNVYLRYKTTEAIMFKKEEGQNGTNK